MSRHIFSPVPSDPPAKSAHQSVSGFIRLMTDHETLYDEGDTADFVYEIVRGVIKEYATLPDGRRQITRFHASGDIFGFSDNGMEAHSTEAIGQTKLRCYPYKVYLQAAADNPSSARKLIEQLMRRQIETEERMVMLGCMSALQRVAYFLNGLASQKPGAEIPLVMSRRDIAEHLGLTPETVCRCIAELKRIGAIEMPTARRMRAVAPEMLHAIAHQDVEA